MNDETTPDEIAAFVMAHLQGAAQAVRSQDIEGVVVSLDAAVSLYERHPSFIQDPRSELLTLLVTIRAARSICETLQRGDDDLRPRIALRPMDRCARKPDARLRRFQHAVLHRRYRFCGR
jgi:hypothetical protein